MRIKDRLTIAFKVLFAKNFAYFQSGWACGPLLGDLENEGYPIRIDDYPWGSVTIFGKENVERLKALKWEDDPIEIKITI